MDFNHKESDVMTEIEHLQAGIHGLCFHDSYQAVSTGPLVPGCAICTRMTHMSFQIGFSCNATCPFCFIHTYQADIPDENEKYNRQALLKEFYGRKDELEGVSLTGGEPLLYLPELKASVSEMRRVKPGLHFWLYTNGILADDEHLVSRAGTAAPSGERPVIAHSLSPARQAVVFDGLEPLPPEPAEVNGCTRGDQKQRRHDPLPHRQDQPIRIGSR